MFSRIEFKADSKEADRILRLASVRVGNLTHELSDVQQAISKDIEEHFNSERGPIGPWTKRKDNKPHKILQKSGALKKSVTTKASADIGKLSIAIKSHLVYAKVHNNGMRIKNRAGRYTKMPKRQFGWISRAVKEESMQIIVKGVLSATGSRI